MEYLPSVDDKKKILKKAIEEFKNSNQTTPDYLNLFNAVTTVLRQGSGLIWNEVEEVITDVLKKGD